MIAHYALGGGLGHLVRAHAVAEALGQEEQTVLLTASPFAGDERVTGGLPVERVPDSLERDPAALRGWIEDLAPDELVVDAFPGGILGELCGFDAAPCRHVARLLRWERYERRLDGSLPRFEETFVLEPLADVHARALEGASDRLAPLELPPAPASPRLSAVDEPHWLVVHAGPEEEVAELVLYARDRMAAEGATARLVVISPVRPPALPAGRGGSMPIPPCPTSRPPSASSRPRGSTPCARGRRTPPSTIPCRSRGRSTTSTRARPGRRVSAASSPER